MTEVAQNFLKLLFNEGETICVSSNKYGYHSVDQSILNGDIFLSPPDEEKSSPIIIKSSDINLVAINPINGFRRDENVTAFRTFMVEIDTGTLEEQRLYIEASGLPYSACVFSGNKSLHYAIVLDKDLEGGIVAWRFYNQWLLNILSKTDQQIKNPSRSIRFPGNKRKDGKKLIQSLVINKGRISQEIFFRWIFQFEDKKPIEKRKKIQGDVYNGSLDTTKIPKDVLDILINGIIDNRNATWFYVACRIAKLGFEMENAIVFLEEFFQEEGDFKKREWEGCIKSAYKRVSEGN